MVQQVVNQTSYRWQHSGVALDETRCRIFFVGTIPADSFNQPISYRAEITCSGGECYADADELRGLKSHTQVTDTSLGF